MEHSKNLTEANAVFQLEGSAKSVECPPEDIRQFQEGHRGTIAVLMLAAFLHPTGSLNAEGGDGTESLDQNADDSLSDCEVKPPDLKGMDVSQKWVMVDGKCRDGLAAERGRAVVYDEEGDVFLSYRGEFSDGSFHGNGRLQLGELYSGQFDYAGEWDRGMPRGFGSLVKQDSSTGEIRRYRGEFKHGNPNGYGFLYISQADKTFLVVYSGEFESGSPKGMGTLIMPDGGMLYGQFDGEQLDGWGSYRVDSDNVSFGEYKDGKLRGKCSVVGPEGVFLGSCKDGAFDGNGAFFSLGGFVFHGEFMNNEANGNGVMLHPNGDTLKGPFEDGTISKGCVTEPGNWRLHMGDCSEGLANGAGIALDIDNGRYYEAKFSSGSITRKLFLENFLGGDPFGRIKDRSIDPDAIRSLLEPKPGLSGTVIESPGPLTLDNFGKGGRAATAHALPKLDLRGVDAGHWIIPFDEMWPQGKADVEELMYYGEAKFGVPHGYGKLVTPDYTFLGRFSYNNRSGYGVLSSPEGSGFGNYHLGKREGLGLNSLANGEGYWGEWVDGKKNGMGIQFTRTSAELGPWEHGVRTGTGTRIRIDLDPSVPEFISILGQGAEGVGLKRMDVVDNNVVFNFLGENGEVVRGVQLYATGEFQVKMETRADGSPHGRGQIVIPGAGIMSGQWVNGGFDASNSRLEVIDSRPEALLEIYQCAKSLASSDRIDVAVLIYETLIKNYPGTVAAKRAKTELRKIKKRK